MEKPEIDAVAQRAFDAMRVIERDEDGNPTTLDGAIRSMILKNPSIIQWRDDALNIMYCVLGTGIEWNKHGRLGDRCPNNYMNMPPQAGGQGIWAEDFGMSDSLEQMGASEELIMRLKGKRLERVRAAISAVIDIDNRVLTYRPARESWYPISWYACHLCAPKNAQEDFYWGAVETANLIVNTELDFDAPRWFENQRTKNYANEILEVLKAQREA